MTTELTWPAIRVVAGKDRVGADILYLTGPEPDFRWPTFIDAVVGLVQGLDVRTVVGLGAFPAPTPHTRPVRLASTVPPQSVELAGRVGTVHGTLEVPAGVQAALEVALGQAGVPVIGLWARVPHYVSAMPYPEASAALIEGLCAVTGTVLDSSSLRDSPRPPDVRWTNSSEPIPSTSRWCGGWRLRSTPKRSRWRLDVDVPSGDEIAAELEQFLRGEGTDRPGRRRRAEASSCGCATAARPRGPGSPAQGQGHQHHDSQMTTHRLSPSSVPAGPSPLARMAAPGWTRDPRGRPAAVNAGARRRWPPSGQSWWPRPAGGVGPRTRRSPRGPARQRGRAARRSGCAPHR